MNAADLRLPPHSDDAEQSLIGGLIIDNRAWDRVADIVTDVDFYRDDHRRIFGHIRKMVETGKQIDVPTLSESIKRSNESDQTGGLGLLGRNCERYALGRQHPRVCRDRCGSFRPAPPRCSGHADRCPGTWAG